MASLESPTRLDIDRSSPVPLYFQLKRTMSKAIESGRWVVGDRLPSEPELCELFGVSRTTVRQALQELEAEGALRREKGRGTFVAETPTRSGFLQSSLGFFDEAVRTGHRVTSRVLAAREEELPGWAAAALGLSKGARGVTLERVRSLDGNVVMYVQNHVLPEFAGGVLAGDLVQSSLYGLLREHYGIEVAGGERTVEAVCASERLATLLEVGVDAPLLFVESVSWNAGRRPFECYRAWHRSDRSKISVQVITEAGG